MSFVFSGTSGRDCFRRFPFSLGEAHSNHVGDPRDQLKSVVYGVLVLGSVAGCLVGRQLWCGDGGPVGKPGGTGNRLNRYWA